MQRSDLNSRLIAENRRARFDYAIDSDLEAGIMLFGSEVKSLRNGGSNITEGYVSVEEGELWLINAHIAPYAHAGLGKSLNVSFVQRTPVGPTGARSAPLGAWGGHDERRRRKLLVSKRELSRLWNATAREGMTIVPLKLYFNERGMVKLSIGVAKGKKAADKRETSARRDWDRQKSRILKNDLRD